MATALKAVPAVPSKACARGARCSFQTALQKRKALIVAIENLHEVRKKHDVRLRVALFVKEVATGFAGASSSNHEDVWEDAMLGVGKKGNATGFDDSFLKEDIDRMQQEIDRAGALVEKRGEALVNYIKRSSFQNHLIKYHRHSYSSDPMLRHLLKAEITAYGFADWRHIDHCVAVLTDHLAQTKAGRDFLSELCSDAALDPKKHPAFSEVWGWYKKAKSLTEPMGMFVHNLAPVLIEQIREATKKKHVTSVAQVLADEHVKAHMTYLADRFGIDAADFIGYIKNRSKQLGSRSQAVKEALIEAENAKRAIKKFNDLGEADLKGALAKIDNAWLSLTIDLVSFWVATAEIRQDYRKTKVKNWLGAVQAFLSLSKTIAGQVEAKQVIKAKELGKKVPLDQVPSISTARYTARSLGVMAGLIGVVTSVMEMDEAKSGKDWDRFAAALAGAVVGTVEFVALLAGAASVAAVCTVIGILIAIILIIVTDHKIIAYLKKTAWGVVGDIKLELTIQEYFQSIFSLTVQYNKIASDPDEDSIILECGAFTKHTPVDVTVVREHDKKSQTVPIRAGKHHAEFQLTDSDGKPVRYGQALTLIIRKPWETWSLIKRDDATAYTIKASFDADRDGKADLVAKTTGVTFQPRPPAKLATSGDYYGLDMFEHETYPREGIGNYIKWPSTGMITFNVYTKYTHNGKVTVKATWDEGDPPESNTWATKINSGSTWHKTTLHVRVDKPPADEEYEVALNWKLLDEKGKALDQASATIWVRR